MIWDKGVNKFDLLFYYEFTLIYINFNSVYLSSASVQGAVSIIAAESLLPRVQVSVCN